MKAWNSPPFGLRSGVSIGPSLRTSPGEEGAEEGHPKQAALFSSLLDVRSRKLEKTVPFAYSFQGAAPSPIIVKIIEPPSDLVGVGDVLLQALGLSGVITLIALALGLLVAGLLFWARRRRPLSH